MRERRERGGHTHPQELPSLSLITAILGLVVAKQLWNVPEKQSALLHPSCLSGSPGAQLLPTWILFIVNPDPCKSHFPVFLPPQSLLPSIRAWLPIVQLSECQLVSCQLLSLVQMWSPCFLSGRDHYFVQSCVRQSAPARGWQAGAGCWSQAQAHVAYFLWWHMMAVCAVLPRPAQITRCLSPAPVIDPEFHLYQKQTLRVLTEYDGK